MSRSRTARFLGWRVILLAITALAAPAAELLKPLSQMTGLYAKAPSTVAQADGRITWLLASKQSAWDTGLCEAFTGDVYPGTNLLLRMQVESPTPGRIYIAVGHADRPGRDFVHREIKIAGGDQEICLVLACATGLEADKAQLKLQIGEMPTRFVVSQLSLAPLTGPEPAGALAVSIESLVVAGAATPTADAHGKSSTKRPVRTSGNPVRQRNKSQDPTGAPLPNGTMRPGDGGSILAAIDQATPSNAGIPGWRAELAEVAIPGHGRQPIWRVVCGKAPNPWDSNVQYPLVQPMVGDQYYRLTLPCRCAAGDGKLTIAIAKASPPWTGLWSEEVRLTTGWRTVTVLFDPTATVPAGDYGFQLQLSAQPQTVEFGEPRLVGLATRPGGTLITVAAPAAP